MCLYTCLLIPGRWRPCLGTVVCVYLLLFCCFTSSVAHVSRQTSATAWKLFLADFLVVVFRWMQNLITKITKGCLWSWFGGIYHPFFRDPDFSTFKDDIHAYIYISINMCVCVSVYVYMYVYVYVCVCVCILCLCTYMWYPVPLSLFDHPEPPSKAPNHNLDTQLGSLHVQQMHLRRPTSSRWFCLGFWQVDAPWLDVFPSQRTSLVYIVLLAKPSMESSLLSYALLSLRFRFFWFATANLKVQIRFQTQV